MVVRDSYQPGTPSWVDLGTPDPAAAAAFYSELFGWVANAAPEPEANDYVMFTSGGHNVAGMGPLMSEEQPSAWSNYVTVEDADATCALALEHGAVPLLEPMDVLDVGRMAIFVDPAGAAISIWQPKAHHGADLVNEPVSLCWNELTVRDGAAATAFYSAVFGWDFSTSTFPGPDGSEMSYTEIQLQGETIAGLMVMDDSWPEEMPSHWMTYFAVADADDIVARAPSLGGTVSAEAFDIPPGRMAVIVDPGGAVFSVMQLNEM